MASGPVCPRPRAPETAATAPAIVPRTAVAAALSADGFSGGGCCRRDRVADARAAAFLRAVRAVERDAVFRDTLRFARLLALFAVDFRLVFFAVFRRAPAVRGAVFFFAVPLFAVFLRTGFFATLNLRRDYPTWRGVLNGLSQYDARMLTRRDFLATSTAAVAATTFGRFDLLLAQQQPPPVNPVFKELRRNTGYWTARGGTIGWLINPGGVVAVDSQFMDTAALCIEQLLKTSGKADIAALINTHHHGDHTGGNGAFRPKTKQIIGHANVPKYMKSTYDQAMARRAQQNPPPTTPAPTEPVVPDKTLTDAMSMEHGDERITMKHYGPAHTGGDIVILFEKANVAHMGDLMFNRLHPVIDRVNGASIANWSVVLDKVAKELPADTIYIFGHAGEKYPVTGAREDLTRHSNYLRALLEFVRTQVKAGKTREQVVALTDTIPGFEDYGPLISRPLGPAFDEVTGTTAG